MDLADLGLTDDTLQPRRFVFASGTTLAPGAYLRVICDPGNTNLGPLVNTNLALKSSGGGVYLFNGANLVSSITYGLQVADLSIGRVPDGSTNWFLCGPTPEGANRTVASLGDPTNLKVNEWMADPGPGNDDWFELYNPDPQPVALGGLHLTDDLNNRTKHRLAARIKSTSGNPLVDILIGLSYRSPTPPPIERDLRCRRPRPTTRSTPRRPRLWILSSSGSTSSQRTTIGISGSFSWRRLSPRH